jgi:hypothetical protein
MKKIGVENRVTLFFKMSNIFPQDVIGAEQELPAKHLR